MPAQQMSQLIIEACIDYKSIEEIAEAVGRTPKYLKDKILSEMVNQGLLKKKYPDYNPNQKYIAVNPKENP